LLAALAPVAVPLAKLVPACPQVTITIIDISVRVPTHYGVCVPVIWLPPAGPTIDVQAAIEDDGANAV
jgi:hypothetical protein